MNNDMAQVTVKYKRNRETRTNGIKAWRVDRTFVVQSSELPASFALGNADARASFYGEAR